MAKIHKKQWRALGKLLVVLVVFALLLKWLTPALASEQLRNFVESIGIFGPFFIIAYVVISHVIAPLIGTPILALSAPLFGASQTIFFFYIAGLISSVITFWISRRFGRKWIIRLSGVKTMAKVDEFVNISGIKILILSRVFGFALFEIISYAAGLTSMKFRDYFLITLVFSAMPAFVFGYFFKDVNLLSGKGMALWVGAIAIVGVIFSFFIKRFIDKRN